jgi:PAB-dependent poly(A)-specific ribonuclease subunit 2
MRSKVPNLLAWLLTLTHVLFAAGALGLFEPEQPDNTISYSMLIQNFIRFILEQLHQETVVPNANPILLRSIAAEEEATSDLPSTIQQVFGLKTTNYSKCSHCSNEIVRTTYPYVVDIMYPKKVSLQKVKGDSRLDPRHKLNVSLSLL